MKKGQSEKVVEVILDEEYLAELALTLRPERTGLPFDIWISEQEYASKRHHRPRLKVFSRQGISASVSIDDPIEILGGTLITGKPWRRLVNYITLNRRALMSLWNEEIDQVDYIRVQRKLP